MRGDTWRPPGEIRAQADRAVEALEGRGLTLGVAESLTGGLVTAAVTSVPGASEVLLGGIVAYATAAKAQLLGVDELLLSTATPVDPQVAEQMAEGARRAFGASVGVATTGEAGPDSATGKPVGTVHIAVCADWGTRIRSLHLSGDRAQIVAQSVAAAFEVIDELLGQEAAPRTP